MTYCLAMRVDQGLALCSDSRTSAGVDNLSVYSKMHRFETTPDRLVVLLSAGNLATTQAVNSQIERDLANPEISRDLNGFSHLDEVAAYVGEISAKIQGTYSEQSEQNGFGASFILGGQIGEQPADIFLIYSAGKISRSWPKMPAAQSDFAIIAGGTLCLASLGRSLVLGKARSAEFRLIVTFVSNWLVRQSM